MNEPLTIQVEVSVLERWCRELGSRPLVPWSREGSMARSAIRQLMERESRIAEEIYSMTSDTGTADTEQPHTERGS